MYFIRKLRLVAVVAAVLPISCLPQQSALSESLLPSCPVPIPKLNLRGVPEDVCGPEYDFKEFGHMAWQTFKTLVWPASGRGTDDVGREITDMKGPRVFETYKGDWETFQASRAEPLPWERYPSRVPDGLCANADKFVPLEDGTLVLAAVHKFGNIDQRDDYEDIFHVLVAQNRTVVRYLTGFGEKAFNTIRNNKLYEPHELVGKPPWYNAPIKGKTKTELGTITVKSAWIDMTGIPDASSFHVRSALVQRPSVHPGERLCDKVTVGLVGLHIAHKTKKSPQWIWASFEHVKNVPPSGYRGTAYTFNNGKGPDMVDEPPPEALLPIDPFVVPPPYNVERRKKIPEKVVDVNSSWQTALRGSVWENYQLVAIQWAGLRGDEELTGSGVQIGNLRGAQPEPPCLSGDANLANSVIETFLQPYTKCSKELTCMTCHNRVRSYDFIWSIPLAHKQPDGVPSETRRAGLSALSEILKSRDRQ